VYGEYVVVVETTQKVKGAVPKSKLSDKHINTDRDFVTTYD